MKTFSRIRRKKVDFWSGIDYNNNMENTKHLTAKVIQTGNAIRYRGTILVDDHGLVGLSPDFIDLNEDELKQVIEAFNQLLEESNFSSYATVFDSWGDEMAVSIREMS